MKEFIVPEPSHAKTHDASELRRLLERVEAASGADREIDVMTRLLVERETKTGALGLTLAQALEQYPGQWDSLADWWRGVTPHYSASLDAALALAERVLPGWIKRLDIYATGSTGGLEPPWSEDGPASAYDAEGKTPALALLAALLKALLAQTEGMAVGDGSTLKDSPAQPS